MTPEEYTDRMLRNKGYERRQAIATAENLISIFAGLSMRGEKEVQAVIDILQANYGPEPYDSELTREAWQHLFGFLIAIREEAKL